MRLCVCSLLLLLGGVAGSAVLPGEVEICDQAEPCFQAAVLPKERLGKALAKEQVLALKLERLRSLSERFPDTLWARRAGLLSGVLSIEPNPAAAIPFLRVHNVISRCWMTTSVFGSLKHT